MIMELWLLLTAVIFTFVGFYMGKESGMHNGINGTLLMLSDQQLIKITELPDGEISIEKAGE